jgi:hypothetical protein
MVEICADAGDGATKSTWHILVLVKAHELKIMKTEWKLRKSKNFVTFLFWNVAKMEFFFLFLFFWLMGRDVHVDSGEKIIILSLCGKESLKCIVNDGENC